MDYKTLNTDKIDNMKSKMFLDDSGTVSIARYDRVKYKVFDRLTEQQLGYFWRPQEIELSKDSKDFRQLTPNEQHIFTSNIKRQIVLDSVQGRAPSIAFLPICSLPELENWIQTWVFSETIHSRSYSHLIRNVYTNPSKVFDEIMDIVEIVDCAKDISKYYDDLIHCNNAATSKDPVPMMEHKKSLWLALNAVNALEGIRFYVSFACSWAFAELKKMEGNAKIIKFIARDEGLHLASTQTMLKLLPKEDPDFVQIKEDCEQEVYDMFKSVIDQEKKWSEYLFKDGSLIGLNVELLNDYVEYIANSRMESIGLKPFFKNRPNPLPWTQKWISGKETQVAPQEAELTTYTIGEVKMDIADNSFDGYKL